MPDDTLDMRAVYERLSDETGYDPNAFVFVHLALQGAMEARGEAGHVDAAEIARAYRKVALDQFGLLSRSVLAHWGVRSTADIGHLVEIMVDAEILTKDEDDRIEDFAEVYPFDDTFDSDYRIGARVTRSSRTRN